MNDLRRIARGWRWGRPSPLPQHAPGSPVRTEAAFDTDWARQDWSKAARALLQETMLLPAVRWMASPTIVGRERLRFLRRPAVFAANHASHLDAALLIAALPPAWRERLAVGAAADTFFTSAPRGWAAALAMGAFPVDRTRASAVSARLAIRLLEEGHSLILFPEGGRSPEGWLDEVKPGAAFAAAKAGRPIVPVWISGTDQLWPKQTDAKPARGQVRVTFGDALHPAPDENARDLNARLTTALERMGREDGSDWWTAARGGGPDPSGPDGVSWRRIWARGARPERPRSAWRAR